MDENVRKLLLKMVRDNPGCWGWYQLDRALSFAGVSGVHVTLLMGKLAECGLVEASGDIQLAATTYTLTDEGRALVGDGAET